MVDPKDLQNAQSGETATDNSKIPAEKALFRINRDLEEKAAQEAAKERGVEYVDVGMFPINPDVLRLFPEERARAVGIVPFLKNGKSLHFAVSDPDSATVLSAVSEFEKKGYKVTVHLASAGGIGEAFRYYVADKYKPEEELKNVIGEDEIGYEKEIKNLEKLKELIATLPPEQALNTLHVSAIRAGASDIHYQPEQNSCLIRFRIDGILHDIFSVDKKNYERLAGQIKYKAKMKLNVATVPQDGRFRFIVNDRNIDVRVASLPTEYGEAFSCRILDPGKRYGRFEELGFRGRSLEILNKAKLMSQGMILVTGPTSSGKTTTLYVLLQQFNKPELKIITLEDPIEYHLRGLTQSQINESEGYDFAAGLRSVLRQDPDVLMIGEVRDLETAEVAAQAALTGHVVLSTLHTNSAVETIPRLLTIGVPAFMVGPALSIVVAQRLVRRLCEKCGKETEITGEEKEIFAKYPEIVKTSPKTLKRAGGCEACNNTGFRGQLVVSEVLEVTDEIKDAILKGKSVADIFAIARKNGMLTMIEDGIAKVADGETTIDEVYRVTNA